VSAAFSEDRKTLSIAVLNPSDTEQSIKVAMKRRYARHLGHLYRMAPDSIDATVQVDKNPSSGEDQTLALFPTPAPPPFSVTFIPTRCCSRDFKRGPDETTEVVHCLRNYIRHRPDHGSAQVQTIVPEVGFRRKPVTVEHIKIHGAGSRSNSKRRCRSRRNRLPATEYERIRSTIILLSMRCMAIDWRRTMVARDSRPQT